MGDQNGGGTQPGLNIPEKVQDLRLNGNIQSSGRLIGQKNLRAGSQGDGHDGSLPHSAGKFKGAAPIAFFRHIDAYQIHQLQYPASDSRFCHPGLMSPHCLRDLRPNGHGRMQRGHGVLKDHREQPAPQALHIPLGTAGDIRPIRQDGSRLDPGISGQELHDGFAQYALAAAGFSHNRQHLAGMEREGQVPDCLHLSLRRVEGDRQIFNFQQFKHSASL